MKKIQRIKKSPQNPTILIAGGASFLGVALSQRLFKQNCRLIVLDNLSSGTRTNLKNLIKREDFTFINCDINEEIPSVIESVDYIFHLAAFEAHLGGGEDVSLNDLLTNSLGTKNLLDLAKKSQAKFLLASSIAVYQGVLSHLDLKYYFGTTEEEQRKFSHAEAKRFAEGLVWEYFKNYNLDVRIARLPHVYGAGMNIQIDAPLGQLLDDLINERNLIVYGEGLDKHYYLYLDDAVDGLVKALFNEDTAGKIFPITELKPVTTLQLAQTVKRLGGKLVQIIHQPVKETVELPELKVIDGANLELLRWQPQVSLLEGLEETLSDLAPQYKETTHLPESQPPQKKQALEKRTPPADKKSKRELLRNMFNNLRPLPMIKFPRTKGFRRRLLPVSLVLGLLSIYFILAPLFLFVYNLDRGVNYLEASDEALKTLDFKEALERNQNSQKSFENAEKNLEKLKFPFRLLGQEKRYSNSFHVILAASFVNQSLQHLILGLDPLFSLLEGALKTPRPQIKEEKTEPLNPQIFNTSLAEVISAKEALQLARAELKGVDELSLPSFIRVRLGKGEEKIENAQENLDSLELAIRVLPKLLGFERGQMYLVLFQNSNEIRPTGGFIGSYAQLNFKEGKLLDLDVDDIYNPDGTLDERNIKIEPPEPIRKHLGQSNWYLRDANWAVSFPEAALDLKRLYALETGVNVDGILAIDLGFVQKMLEVTGPILIATYNEEVEVGNLFEKVELHSAGGYREGAPYKKTFLSTLSQAMLEKIVNLDKKNYPLLAGKFYEALEEKDLLLFLPQTEIKNLIASRHWDGAVKETVGDYLYVVDANVGATKANFYVTRTINYEVAPRDRQGVLEGKLNLTYVHTGTSDAWPGGPYKNYVRILTPKGTRLIRAEKISEDSDPKKIDITNQIETKEEAGKTAFATVFTLNHSKSLSLTIIYELPPHLNLTPEVSEYSLFLQKQPGTQNDPVIFTLSIPFGRSVTRLPATVEKVGDILRYSGELKRDLEFIFPLD